jgi:hypothetical protein
VKSERISIKIRLGSAISNASGVNAERTVVGMTLCRIIKNPIIPIPRRTATDSKVIRNISIRLATFSTHQFLVDG